MQARWFRRCHARLARAVAFALGQAASRAPRRHWPATVRHAFRARDERYLEVAMPLPCCFTFAAVHT